MDEFSRIKKIDAHTHIGAFGNPKSVRTVQLEPHNNPYIKKTAQFFLSEKMMLSFLFISYINLFRF